MKILIGTPTHIIKDYAMERWLKAVDNLEYPASELYLVDNSPTSAYSKYLKSISPKSVKTTVCFLKDIPYTDPEERVSFAREAIRRKVLDEGFDYWFSWECDTIAPPDTLTKLLQFTNEFRLIHHTSPSRTDPDNFDGNTFGVSLIHKSLLAKFAFELEWGHIDPYMPNTYHGADSWFNRRVIRSGEKFIELSGIIKPIQHLEK
jgi:hypothetical protein